MLIISIMIIIGDTNLTYYNEKSAFLHNLGQNIVDKFMKLSKIGFYIECVTADFSQFTSTPVKVCLVVGWALAIIPGISEIFLKFSNLIF